MPQRYYERLQLFHYLGLTLFTLQPLTPLGGAPGLIFYLFIFLHGIIPVQIAGFTSHIQ